MEQKLKKLIELVDYWTYDPATWLNNREECIEHLKKAINEPVEQGELRENEVKEEVCECGLPIFGENSCSNTACSHP